MKKTIGFIGIVIFVMGTGCASIVSKSQYPVTITSNPVGATVTVKNKSGVEIHRAVTPATISLSASNGFFSSARYTLEFQKEGHLPGSTSFSAGLDGWYFGNILLGGIIGMLIVDPATGAMWKLDDMVYGNLAPETSSSTSPAPMDSKPPPQSVSDQLKELKELKDLGVLTDEEYEKKRKALINEL